MSEQHKVITFGEIPNLPFEKAVKRAIPIDVIQIHEPFQVETNEKIMKGKPGDYPIKGVAGELYPIDKEIYEKSYEPARDYLSLHFTLKGDIPFRKIKHYIQRVLINRYEGRYPILLHAFLPREHVVKNGFSTKVVDMLDELFPYQINFCPDGKPDREALMQAIVEKCATAYFVGEIKNGVFQEFTMLKDKLQDKKRKYRAEEDLNICAIDIKPASRRVGI